MFWFRDSREGEVRVDLAFTDATVDLSGARDGLVEALASVQQECGVGFARTNQVHGDVVVEVSEPEPSAHGAARIADALITTRQGVGLMVKAADCVPLVLADVGAGVVGVVHSGRDGTVLDVTTRTVEAMRERGAATLTGWIGPHVCGGCYEVPEQMRAEVAAAVPSAWGETSWGSPSVDLGAAVRSQLEAAGVEVVDVPGCTREEPRLHSYRRDGADAGRLAGLVWMP